MKQLLYVSENAQDGHPADLDAILDGSRHNNAIDGITGLLWTDGRQFLQVLEGPDDSVEQCFARIRADPRHRNVTVLHEAAIKGREFGTWTMARRTRHDSSDGFDGRMRRLLERASPEVAAAFGDLLADRPAA